MVEHPNPKKPQFKNYHQIMATVLNFDNNLNVMEQIKSEIKKVINRIMSDAFQGMYIDMCKMMLSAIMVELSKSHKNIKQNEFKDKLWTNMLAGLTHPQIIFKNHLRYFFTDRGVELMIPKLFPGNGPLPAESLWDPAVTEFACDQN